MPVFQRAIFIFIFVIPERFERSTHSLEGCCSIQLSYGTPFNPTKLTQLFRLCKILYSSLRNVPVRFPLDSTRFISDLNPYTPIPLLFNKYHVSYIYSRYSHSYPCLIRLFMYLCNKAFTEMPDHTGRIRAQTVYICTNEDCYCCFIVFSVFRNRCILWELR